MLRSLLILAVQIHYVKEWLHWVATSYRDGQVKLYDSLFNGKLSPSLEVQLIQLYRPAIRDGGLLVTAESVQQQSGGTDCGAFGIAFAYYAAQGKDVSKLEMKQEDLREHIRLCFERQELPHFPLPTQTSRSHRRSISQSRMTHTWFSVTSVRCGFTIDVWKLQPHHQTHGFALTVLTSVATSCCNICLYYSSYI